MEINHFQYYQSRYHLLILSTYCIFPIQVYFSEPFKILFPEEQKNPQIQPSLHTCNWLLNEEQM